MKTTTILRMWYVVVTVVGTWVLYISHQFLFSTETIDTAVLPGDQHHLPGGVPRGLDSPKIDTADDDFDPTRLIFLISMGKEAKDSKLVERFVWSARHRGEWQGYILLLTDAPIERYQGFSNRFLVMNPDPKDFDDRFLDDMPYKRFKTMIIDYINKDARLNDARLIYYLDADNIVGNSLSNMFQDVETKYNIPGKLATSQSGSSSSSNNNNQCHNRSGLPMFSKRRVRLRPVSLHRLRPGI